MSAGCAFYGLCASAVPAPNVMWLGAILCPFTLLVPCCSFPSWALVAHTTVMPPEHQERTHQGKCTQRWLASLLHVAPSFLLQLYHSHNLYFEPSCCTSATVQTAVCVHSSAGRSSTSPCSCWACLTGNHARPDGDHQPVTGML